MAKIARLNRLPETDKNRIYSLLIPPSILSRLQIDPGTGLGPDGEQCLIVEAPEGGSEASVRVVRSLSDTDPVFFMEVSESRDLVRLLWDFIRINDLDSPRFNTDVTPEGGDRWLNWRTRNIEEELGAKSAGLAPGQVRRGLGVISELNDCLDEFSVAVGFKSVFLEALFYHTAIIFERHGFRYFEGEPMMGKIHEEFKPGGVLYGRLGGSPFRKPEFANTARGRSWAIHDGILDDAEDFGIGPWSPPKMYRMAGKHFEVDTAPGVVY